MDAGNKEMPKLDRSPIKIWEEDTAYQKIYWEVAKVTRVDPLSCYNLYQFAMRARHLPGEIAEAGVYRGGSARMLAEVFKETAKSIHLFDTYGGMPPVDPRVDIFKEGDFHDTTLEGVKDYLSDFSNLHFHKGRFPETTSELPDDIVFCYVHADMDIFSSTLSCCEYFYPRLTNGGVLIFDDYGFRKCAGAKIAVDKFVNDHKLDLIYLPTGQCLLIKTFN